MIANLCTQTKRSFDQAMDNNLDTPSAIRVFMKFVNEISRMASVDAIHEEVVIRAKPIIHYMLNILGLRIASITPEERKQIDSMIEMREKLRKMQKYKEADSVRIELANKYSVELTDHKYKTTWRKREFSDI